MSAGPGDLPPFPCPTPHHVTCATVKDNWVYGCQGGGFLARFQLRDISLSSSRIIASPQHLSTTNVPTAPCPLIFHTIAGTITMSASPGRGRPPNSLPDLYRPVASTTYQGTSSTQYQPPPHQATSRTNSVSSPSGGSGVFAIPVSSNTIPVGSTTYPHSDRSTIGTYVEPPPGESIGNGVGQQQLTAIDQPNANAENLDCCTSSCASLFFKWFLLYIILITIAAVIAARLLPELGLFLLSVLPAMTLLSFLETQFRKSVIRMQVSTCNTLSYPPPLPPFFHHIVDANLLSPLLSLLASLPHQMLISFFEAVLWMVPIVILENLTNYFLIVRTKLPKEGYCGMCILSAFLQAYLIAGLFEVS